MANKEKTVLLLSKKSRRRWNTHKTLTLVNFDYSFNCLSTFIHSNQLFQTITQSFYTSLSHIIIRERQRKGTVGVREVARVIKYPRAYKLSAGLIIIRAGGPARSKKSFENFFRNSLKVPPKNVAQFCKKRHCVSLYIETNYRLCITECYCLSYYMHPQS